jgi:hypothetical protein
LRAREWKYAQLLEAESDTIAAQRAIAEKGAVAWATFKAARGLR